MKRVLIALMVVAVSLSGTATDRFYINDFSISTGQTRQVSIMLDNEVEYTAFQADIHLTGGLEIIKENGSFPIALTNHRGHHLHVYRWCQFLDHCCSDAR